MPNVMAALPNIGGALCSIIIIIINRHFKHAKLQKSVAKARAATYQIVTKTKQVSGSI